MRIREYEESLAGWLRATHPEILEAYEAYLQTDLSEIYFLDLLFWLRRDRPEIWSEYVEILRNVVPAARALFAAVKEALQKFDDAVEANPAGTPMLGSESWVTAQEVTVYALGWKGWLKREPQMLPICDDWLERAIGLDPNI